MYFKPGNAQRHLVVAPQNLDGVAVELYGDHAVVVVMGMDAAPDNGSHLDQVIQVGVVVGVRHLSLQFQSRM